MAYLKKDASILEIGTGPGRDADYIESLGYSVTRSDAVESFIEYNKSKNKNIIKLNLYEDKIE